MKRHTIPQNQVADVLREIRNIKIGEHDGAMQTLDIASSWAVYPTGDEDHRPTDDELKRETLTTSVVLMGANWGASGKGRTKEELDEDLDKLVKAKAWSNFHRDPTKPHTPGLPHSRLRAALLGDGLKELQGAYMSDVVKLLATPDAGRLGELLRTNEDEAARCERILREELELCQRHNRDEAPLIIALGLNAYKLLVGGTWGNKVFGTGLADVIKDVTGQPAETVVRYARHYSDAIGPNGLTESLKLAVSRHDEGDQSDFVTQDNKRVMRNAPERLPLSKNTTRAPVTN